MTVCLSILGLSAFAGETLESLLAKHYEAMGGLDNLRDIQSMTVEGQIEAQTYQSKFRFAATKNRCRLDIYTDTAHIVRIFDGRRAWEINPILGTHKPQPLNERQTAELRDYMDMSGSLVDWQTKGHQVTYDGLVDVKGRQLHKVPVEHKLGINKVYFVDPETYLVAMILEPGQGKDKDYLAKVMEYDTVGGIKVFKRIMAGKDNGCCHTVHANDEDCGGFYKNVSYNLRTINETLDPSLFSVEQTMRAQRHKRPGRD